MKGHCLFAFCIATSFCSVLSQITENPPTGSIRIVYAGLSNQFSLSATVPGASVVGQADATVGMPRNAALYCQQSNPNGCSSYTLSFNPKPDQAGKTFSVCIIWKAFPSAGTSKPACVVLNVLSPQPTILQPSGNWYYGGRIQQSSNPATYSFRANVGCLLSVPLSVTDSLANSPYDISLRPLILSSFPPSLTGLPQAIAGTEGLASLEPATNTSAVSKSFLFRWRPARGQESSKLYRTCFEAVDSLGVVSTAPASSVRGLGLRSVCFRILVEKCQYCVQPGESLNSVAMQLDTDWLHVYTANPTILDPDNLLPYTRINTGVLYLARKGDTGAALAQQFFTTLKSLQAVNPDLALQAGELTEGEAVCVLPPVCNVECVHGADCQPLMQ